MMASSQTGGPHREFCTFFDKNYLARGLALYYSLVEHCPSFTLWIMCGDEENHEMLRKLALPHIKLLRATEVEDERMRAIKPTRTPIEYIWLFGSQLPLYLLEKEGLETITYLDSDMYFYSSPDSIYREFGHESVIIIPHRYSRRTAIREKTSGIYNVGMMTYRNDQAALECLHWWKDRCLEWCYNRYEDGKFGDQLYLDDWPTRFRGVHVLRELGANVAPWNIDNYRFDEIDGRFVGYERSSGKRFELIVYHFHPLKIYLGRDGEVKPYPITIYHIGIYRKYLKGLQKAYNDIRSLDPSWSYGTKERLGLARMIKQYVTIYLTR